MDSDAIGWSIAISFYLYVTICLFLIARKTGTDWAWFAFVPLMGVAEVRGKPAWMGLMMLIPGVNLIFMGYLAFSA